MADQSLTEQVCAAHRQRLLLAATLLLQETPPEPCGPNREPVAFCWTAHCSRLTEAEFKQRYRLSPESFDKLLAILQPGLAVKHEQQALNSRSGNPIQIEARLAVALRYFAGGDTLDLKLIYCMSRTMVYSCIWSVVDAINQHLDNINFPIDDLEGLKQLEAGFRAASRGGFWQGQVGAIDGVHFRMSAPSNKDVPDPVRYKVSRKDMYALLAIAICDADRRFTWVDISHASCTHDSTAFACTELGMAVDQGALPAPFFLNGDAAFTLSPSMITPSNNDPELDDFDFYQSSNRMPIECAFGILIRRWGVLWRPLTQEFSARAPLIVALMHLHNFCIDEKLQDDMPDVSAGLATFQPGRTRRPPRFDKDGRPVWHLDTCRSTDEGAPSRSAAQQRGAKTSRRDVLVQAIRDGGYRRILSTKAAPRKRKGAKGRKKDAKRLEI